MQATATWVDRALAYLDGDDAATELSKVRSFQRILMLIVCVEFFAKAAHDSNDLQLNYWIGLPLITVLGVATLSARWRRAAFAGLAIAQSVRIWNGFPSTGNHSYLELLLCSLSAFLDIDRREERTLFLRSVRWMTCVVFFYAGLQKLVHGYYFRGEVLAYSIGLETFRPVLQLLLGPDDLVRLSHYQLKVGEGPFVVSTPYILVLSNATYMIEMGLVPLLVSRWTRTVAVIGAIVFLLAIETMAHEFFFGLLFINMLLMFLDRDVNRRLVGLFAVALGCMLLARLKVIPEVVFY